MCGIVGVIQRDPRKRPDERRIVAAREALAHRGPDEAGIWVRDGVALAHRRLKVIDLVGGQQPMVAGDRLALVYNGEVYNYRELRRTFEAAGATFASNSDTEIVFHALNTEGPAALTRFRGMFALAHWDDACRTLLLARDRLGKKPLYWHADEAQFVFASELKAILTYVGRRFDISAAALDEFFTRGCMASPRTIFRGIHMLPAAHRLMLDATAWTWAVDPWWDVTPVEIDTDDEPAVIDRLDNLLDDAVRQRLHSDVPLGCLLSGGIDSSIITAMAARAAAESGGGPVRAFTIGFENEAYDERPFAQIVARHCHCEWESRVMAPGDYVGDLYEAQKFFDEPFGNFTVTSQIALSRLCRESLTVVLSGQGGDELTAGYPGRYNWVLETQRAAEGDLTRTGFAAAVDDPMHHLHRSGFLGWRGAREVMFSPALKEALTQDAGSFDALAAHWPRHRRFDRLNRVLYADLKTNLPDYLLTIEDRAAMSCGLEARHPLLDDRVVDFLMSLPPSFKVREGRNKWILHRLAERYLPRAAFDRPKRGFTPPLEQWIARQSREIVRVFLAQDGHLRRVFSDDWMKLLTAGRFQGLPVMAVHYSLVLALWAQRYGEYIGEWPGGAVGGDAPASPWHVTMRAQEPEHVAESRWFVQALKNLEPGSTIRLVGDRDDFHRFLARSAGLAAADGDMDEPDAVVVIGLEAAEGVLAHPMAASATMLWFIPFDGRRQARVDALVLLLAAKMTVEGMQALELGPERGLLVAMGRTGEAELRVHRAESA